MIDRRMASFFGHPFEAVLVTNLQHDHVCHVNGVLKLVMVALINHTEFDMKRRVFIVPALFTQSLLFTRNAHVK